MSSPVVPESPPFTSFSIPSAAALLRRRGSAPARRREGAFGETEDVAKEPVTEDRLRELKNGVGERH